MFKHCMDLLHQEHTAAQTRTKQQLQNSILKITDLKLDHSMAHQE